MIKHDYKFGWRRQLPDFRDFLVAPLTLEEAQALPPVKDLAALCPPVYDQGQLGSCTANAIAGACEYEWMRQKKAAPYVPSRLFIYYNERDLEGTVPYDAGAVIRDGMKVIASEGICPESYWPYDISQFTAKPSLKAYQEATKELVKSYEAVHQDLNSLKGQLAKGFAVVFGFTVYSSMMTSSVAATGNVPMPGRFDWPQGGHAVLLVGYNDETNLFKFRNCWGSGWGNKGYGTLPYAYVTDPNLAADFWSVTFV